MEADHEESREWLEAGWIFVLKTVNEKEWEMTMSGLC